MNEKELKKIVEERKEEIKKYKKEHNGELNPIVISNTIFRGVVEGNFEYTERELGPLYSAYKELITEVNDKIGIFPSSLPTFCKFIGITLNILQNYKDSADYETKEMVNRIYDEINDDNLFLAQLGHASEKSTMFRLKSQNEMTEKKNPNVNITFKKVLDEKRYDRELEKYEKLLGNAKKKN